MHIPMDRMRGMALNISVPKRFTTLGGILLQISISTFLWYLAADYQFTTFLWYFGAEINLQLFLAVLVRISIYNFFLLSWCWYQFTTFFAVLMLASVYSFFCFFAFSFSSVLLQILIIPSKSDFWSLPCCRTLQSGAMPNSFDNSHQYTTHTHTHTHTPLSSHTQSNPPRCGFQTRVRLPFSISYCWV